jgi:hypothetical protein
MRSSHPSELALTVERWLVEAEQRGEARGLRAGVLAILDTRSLTLGELGRARLESCEDLTILTRWLVRAASAASEAEVFAGGNAGEQLFAEGFARGFAEKKAAVLRTSIAMTLAARAVVLTAPGRARLESANLPTLTRWLDRAATATSEAEVFATDS